jgi:hypothetical protein
MESLLGSGHLSSSPSRIADQQDSQWSRGATWIEMEDIDTSRCRERSPTMEQSVAQTVIVECLSPNKTVSDRVFTG